MLSILTLSCATIPIIAKADNVAPVLKIISPKDGDKFEDDEEITLLCMATDPEDGELEGKSIEWVSGVGKRLGYGKSLSCKMFSGFHIITVVVKDSGGSESFASVFVTVGDPTRPKPGALENTEIVDKATGSPSLTFTSVPNYGSNRNLHGKTNVSKPSEYGVAVYIGVSNRWWTKPTWENPVTKIRRDKSWVCDITTGGIDERANRIVAYLIPLGFDPPLAYGHLKIPASISNAAIANAEAIRDRSGVKILNYVPKELPKGINKLKGVCYGPFGDNENPDMSVFPLDWERDADSKILSNITESIRTYGSVGTPGLVPNLCERVGIYCYPGAWLGKYKTENEKEIQAVINIGKSGFSRVKGIIVGNEVLLRKDMNEQGLFDCIRKVKKDVDVPVSTAEIWSTWLDHKRLALEVDYIIVHIHPYWEGVPIEDAARHVVDIWRHIKNIYSTKRVLIGETGWPSKGKKIGDAVPSGKNQARFYAEFTALAEQEGIEYFYFALFDEKWKDKFEGEARAHWGIYNTDGSLKEHLKGMVPENAESGTKQP